MKWYSIIGRTQAQNQTALLVGTQVQNGFILISHVKVGRIQMCNSDHFNDFILKVLITFFFFFFISFNNSF